MSGRDERMNIYAIRLNDSMIIVISNPLVLKIENNWKQIRLIQSATWLMR